MILARQEEPFTQYIVVGFISIVMKHNSNYLDTFPKLYEDKAEADMTVVKLYHFERGLGKRMMKVRHAGIQQSIKPKYSSCNKTEL